MAKVELTNEIKKAIGQVRLRCGWVTVIFNLC